MTNEDFVVIGRIDFFVKGLKDIVTQSIIGSLYIVTGYATYERY